MPPKATFPHQKPPVDATSRLVAFGGSFERQLCLLTRAVPTALGLAACTAVHSFRLAPSKSKVSLTVGRGDARCVVPRWRSKSLAAAGQVERDGPRFLNRERRETRERGVGNSETVRLG